MYCKEGLSWRSMMYMFCFQVVVKDVSLLYCSFYFPYSICLLPPFLLSIKVINFSTTECPIRFLLPNSHHSYAMHSFKILTWNCLNTHLYLHSKHSASSSLFLLLLAIWKTLLMLYINILLTYSESPAWSNTVDIEVIYNTSLTKMNDKWHSTYL